MNFELQVTVEFKDNAREWVGLCCYLDLQPNVLSFLNSKYPLQLIGTKKFKGELAEVQKMVEACLADIRRNDFEVIREKLSYPLDRERTVASIYSEMRIVLDIPWEKIGHVEPFLEMHAGTRAAKYTLKSEEHGESWYFVHRLQGKEFFQLVSEFAKQIRAIKGCFGICAAYTACVVSDTNPDLDT